MDRADEVVVDGIVGNADRGGRRQITLISAERWRVACQLLGEQLDPALRRANVMVSGIDLAETRGRHILLGEVELEITTETVPCRLMDFADAGLMHALHPDWGGGVSTCVVTPGIIHINAPVHLTDIEP